MTWFLLPPLGDAVTRPVFELGRVQSNADLVAPVAAALAIMVVLRMIYRADARELRPAIGWMLTGLRWLVVLALLLVYLQPQWRIEEERRINSRALVLVDGSLSMGITDETTGAATRSGQLAEALKRSRLVERLRRTHDVAVYRFGEKLEPILVGERLSGDDKSGAAAPREWPKSLAPTATQTRLGEALAEAIGRQRDVPVSGILLLTDGGQNAGVGPEAAMAVARRASIPVFPVGFGSDRRPAELRISDFVVPTRAYPGDQYAATGYLQATGLAGQTAEVELRLAPVGPSAATPNRTASSNRAATVRERSSPDAPPPLGEVVETREVILPADGEVLPVRFELTPKTAGRQTLTLVIKPANGVDVGGDRREADVEVVDRKTRVLLLAGGPSREYRFLRGLLHRDKSVELDVLLQSASGPVSQEADRVLDDFPATREALYQYDAVVAIDPDWQSLSDQQIALVEQWVAEQSGGLILVAGTVNMGNSISGWIQDPRMAKIRALYPVMFERRFATDATSYASDEPWRLDFTSEGRDAEFLRLADDRAASTAAWKSFPGVYSFYPVQGPKPGATVLARFSDPKVGSGDRRPVWAATQFYGSGRVLYLGSGELWRLRAVDETYFETIYTKLLRHVSQGRLLRGSSRGVLLVDRDRHLLGSTVEVRAQLTDARLEPLATKTVELQVFPPRGAVRTIALAADPARAGNFAGRFPALEEGAWRLELPIPESDERLARRIQVRMPELERENPQRNDALLSRIAKETGGRYYVGADAALPKDGSPGVVGELKDRTKTVIVTGPPSREWQRQWLRRVMLLICGLLFTEWLIRRLVRLA